MEFQESALGVETMGEGDDAVISNIHHSPYVGASMGSAIRSH